MKVTPLRNLHKKVANRGSQTLLLKSVRNSLIATIKVSTGLDVTHLATGYFNTVDKWFRCMGKRSTTLRLKNCYLLALNSMNNSPKEVSMIAVNKRGFPRVFAELEQYFRSNQSSPQAMQAVLSILGYYRGILAPGVPDLSSITTAGPDIPDSLIDEIISLGFDPDWKFHPKRISPIQLKLRSKKGPNGQSTINAVRDLKVLPESVFKALITIVKKSDDPDGLAFQLGNLRSKGLLIPNSLHSKLSIKRELGGKDRAFAMVDYYSQTILEPLHTELSNILKSNPQDCTFDQSSGRLQMMEWSKGGSSISIDLSSASDRFPVKLQSKIIEHLTDDKEFSDSWETVMVDRDFIYKGKPYRWAVGQPLGALSSWPSFALAHHIVMRAAHKKANLPFEYFILGDDVAMKESQATPIYLDYLSKLGVSISPIKGLNGYSIEFAKRIYHKGVEVSPIPVPMLHTLHKDLFLYSEYITKVKERSSVLPSDLRVQELSLFFAKWFRKDIKLLSILAEYPIPLLRTNPSGRDTSFDENPSFKWAGIVISKDDLSRLFDEVRYSHLICEIDRCQRSYQKWYNDVNTGELPGVPTSIRRMHPLFYAFGNFQDEVLRAKEDVNQFLNSSDMSKLSPSVAITNVTSLIKGSRKSSHHTGKLLLELYDMSAKQWTEAQSNEGIIQ